jgi:hypothetical protein
MRGIILRRQRKQISNPSLMNRGREICAVTEKTNRLRRCNFCKGVSHKVCISTNPIKGTRAENRNHIFSICNNGKYAPRSLIVPSIDGIHAYFGITLNHNIGETISLSEFKGPKESHCFSYTWIRSGVPFSPEGLTILHSTQNGPQHH